MGYELQRSFAAGEISPKSYLRNDGNKSAMREAAVETMLNMVPDPHGIAESRLGFDLIEEILTEDNSKLFTFSVNSAESYAIVITDGKLYVLDDDGFVNVGQLVLDNLFFFGGIGWTFNNASTLLNFARLDAAGYISTNVVISNVSTSHMIRVFGSNTISEDLESAEIRILVGTAVNLSDISDSGVVIGNSIEYQFNHAAGITDFYVTIVAQGNPKDIRKVECFEGFTPAVVSFVINYKKYELPLLNSEMVPGQTTMYIVGKVTQPMKELKLVQGGFGANSVWTFVNISFTFDINGAPWSTLYPGSIAFFDGRMALGGTNNILTTVWLSKPNDYTNFDFGTGALADDALALPLNDSGSIQWLLGGKSLIVGLDTSEHIIFANASLSPNDAQTNRQSTYGSSNIKAILVGEEVAYIDVNGRKTRLMNYVRDEDGWASYDITFDSEHITKNILSEMRFGYSPIGRFVFRDFNGQLVLANYERDRGTIGWYSFLTNGFIQSMTVIKKNGKDVIWTSVVRNGKLLIEKQDVNENSTHHMDSALSFILGTGITATIFFGFNHLIGSTVQVLADDKVHPDLVVAGDGSITINYAANKVVVGLGYLARIKTLREMGEIQAGNSIVHKKRFSNLAISIQNSSAPIVNGSDTFLRYPPTLMVEREDLRTEILELPLLGWSNDSSIIVEQPLPLPLIVNGIGGKLKASKL